MVNELKHETESTECEPVDRPTNDSVVSSDILVRERIHSESPDLYVFEKRNRNRRYDPNEWDLEDEETRTETVEIRVYSRRKEKTKHVDFCTDISSYTSESIRVFSGRKGKTKHLDFCKDISSCTSESIRVFSGRKGKTKHVDFCKDISSCTSESIRVFSGRKGKMKHVDFCKDISSCTSESIPMEYPNPCARPKGKYTRKSRSGSRQSRRITKDTTILPERLTNLVFDHWFQYMWRVSPEERKKLCTYLNCFFFGNYALDQYREKVVRWTNGLNLLSKKYVFVPILLWSHWSLLVFCNLGESLDSKTSTPCLLLLDSLHAYGSPPKLEPLIRRFVLDIFKAEGRPVSKDMVENIPLLVPKVPQQNNDMDCGIFVLYFIKKFLQAAPENFSISDGYPYFMTEDWFTEKQLNRFYKKLEAFGPRPVIEECSSDPEYITQVQPWEFKRR